MYQQSEREITWFCYCYLHLFYIVAVPFTTGAFSSTHQWVVVLPGWCNFVVSIRLPQETLEYYHICVLLSAVVSSIIWITDTLLLCKSLQVNDEVISRTRRKPVFDAVMLQLRTMMPVQEWIIFHFWMNGFSSSCKCPYRCLIKPAFSRLKIPFW